MRLSGRHVVRGYRSHLPTCRITAHLMGATGQLVCWQWGAWSRTMLRDVVGRRGGRKRVDVSRDRRRDRINGVQFPVWPGSNHLPNSNSGRQHCWCVGLGPRRCEFVCGWDYSHHIKWDSGCIDGRNSPQCQRCGAKFHGVDAHRRDLRRYKNLIFRPLLLYRTSHIKRGCVV